MNPTCRLRLRSFGRVFLLIVMAAGSLARGDEAGVIATEFVFKQAPFNSCHASTIADTPAGLVAAWFGGTREGAGDVGIWFARRTVDRWTAPVEVATGRQESGTRYPCWNPVLFQVPGGPLLLFYKVGPSPSKWWGMLTTSTDKGRKWSPPTRLPEGIFGPIKNKPVLLPDGALLCPSSTEDNGWRVHIERTTDLGRTWTKTAPLNDGKTFAAIQPAILVHPASTLQIVCRSRQGKIVQAWSTDGGATWGPLEATPLPNPNSGIDAVTLADGRALLVYNHTPKGRSPLNVALSPDGKTWKAGPVLENEPGEYSYPAVIQTADGRVHVTYTWKRQRIKHAVLDPAKITTRDLP
jgi:predicted neuraminidase